MSKTYTCAICGKQYDNVNDYLKCVALCGEKLKKKEAEKEQKRIEEINAALNRVKQAKVYYEEQLANFKEKYPEEYKLNFECYKPEKKPINNETTKSDNQWHIIEADNAPKYTKVKKEQHDPESVRVLYTKENDNKPEIRAKVNGKDTTLEGLLKDDDARLLAKLLGLI